ncbi:MAG: prolipoprotein diacylglyceryl transferase, partial [Paludibacter sp.]|nr:prolipoprotein diacylglyceryl transferase [Paludibacter sp.]
MILNYITWNVDPEIFSIGGIHIRWYGLLWALGIWLTLIITQKLFKHEKLSDKWLDSLFIYTVLGAVIGARVGHCLFYNPAYYLANPIEILFIWQGGLASHGGAIGIIVSTYLYNKKVSKKGFIWVFDRLVIGVAVAGAMIRLGNLMNSEIYGGPTTLPWGFIFVRDG